MTNFIKSTDTIIHKYKLFIFYILNLTDILFTQFVMLKMPDLFFEANPFLAPIIHTHYALLLKVFVPAILLWYWSTRFEKATLKEKKVANISINTLTFIFLIINVFHLLNVFIVSRLVQIM